MKKNIFFLFPPGYSGNYLQWLVNASETSKKDLITKDPLLSNGTTHGFARLPTHTGVYNIMTWIIKNQPATPQTFIVLIDCAESQWQNHAAHVAYRFLKSYPDAMFVNIYAGTADETKVAALNGYTKWTTWLYDLSVFENNKDFDFDWEGGKNNIVSLKDRNWLLANWRQTWHLNDKPFNWEELDYNISKFQKWYRGRETMEPLDTNNQQYYTFDDFSQDCILDISLGEIYDKDFVNHVFFQWLENKNVGDFDWSYAKLYHTKYLAAQDNLKWFHDITIMRRENRVSRWLLKNSLSQAFLLEEVACYLDQVKSWQVRPTQEILMSLGFTIEQ